MKTYIMLSVLTPEGRKTVQETPDRIRHVNKTVENHGVKIVSQYALLGPYDFLTVLQAEDEKSVFKIATELTARGSMQTTTFSAMPIDEFIKDIMKTGD